MEPSWVGPALAIGFIAWASVTVALSAALGIVIYVQDHRPTINRDDPQ